MRTAIIILAVFAFVQLGVWIVREIENYNVNRTQQVEIDFLRAKNVKDKDLFEKRLKLKDDSLNIAYQVIEQANKERIEAHERTQRMIKNYEQIIFIKYASDSARHRKLAELYPSYRIP